MPMADSVREIDAVSLKAALERGAVRLIDVREADEHAREFIAGDALLPLSRFDPAAVAAKPGQGPGQAIVLYCASGRRSADAAGRLRAAGVADVANLKGGIAAWKQAGLPVAGNSRAPLPIMRQVQIAAGGMTVLGVALGYAVHPGFFLLAGFVGAGLALAGITGTCAMATLLAKLPYNRPRTAS